MPAYTVHVTDPGTSMNYNTPVSAAETCALLLELQELGFEQITIVDHHTGERTTDVSKFLEDHGGAQPG